MLPPEAIGCQIKSPVSDMGYHPSASESGLSQRALQTIQPLAPALGNLPELGGLDPIAEHT